MSHQTGVQRRTLAAALFLAAAVGALTVSLMTGTVRLGATRVASNEDTTTTTSTVEVATAPPTTAETTTSTTARPRTTTTTTAPLPVEQRVDVLEVRVAELEATTTTQPPAPPVTAGYVEPISPYASTSS